MANTIKVTVVAKNGISLISCPTSFHLPCPSGTVIDGRDFYFHSDDLQQTWKYPPELTAAVLPAAGFPVARAVTYGTEYYIIADQGSPSTDVNQIVANACSQCCVTSPAGEPSVGATASSIIPTLQHMTTGKITQDCTDGTCTYDYFDTLPADSPEPEYNLQFSCGGVLYTSGAVHFETIAAALAWAQANWSALATWTLSGNQLKAGASACSVGNLSHTRFV